MAEPEYTVTITIGTVDRKIADFARDEGASLVRLTEELASRSDARTLTHTRPSEHTVPDPGNPGASYVGQLATAVADELERRKTQVTADFLAMRGHQPSSKHLPFCTSLVPGVSCDCATRETP